MHPKLKELFRDAVVYGLTGATGQSLQLLLVPIYSRVFLPDSYGVVEVITATAAGLSLLLGLQIDSGVSRHYYEEADEAGRRRLMSTGLWTLATVAGGACALLAGSADVLAPIITGEVGHASSLALALLSIPFGLLATYVLLICRLDRQVFVYSVLGILWISSTLGLSVLFVVPLDMGIPGVFAAKLLADAGVAIAALVLRRDMVVAEFSRTRIRAILSFGLPLVPSVAAGWSQRYVDRFMILGLLTGSHLGVYSVGLRISSVMLLLNRAFQLAWTPFSMSVIQDKDRGDLYAKALDWYAATAGVVGAGLVLFAPELVTLAAPDAYEAAVSVVGILVAAWLLRGIFNVVAVGTKVAKKTRYTAIAFVTGAVLNAVLQMWLLPVVGIEGAAWATLMAFVLSTVLMYVFSQRLEPVPYALGRVAGALGVAAGFVAVGAWMVVDLPPGAGLLAGKAVVWLTASAATLWVATEASDRRGLLRALGVGDSCV